MLNVQRHGLFRQQMHRNGVIVKGVQYDYVEFLELSNRRFSFERHPGVAQHNVDYGRRIAQESEPRFLP